MAMQNHATGPAGQTIARGNMKVIRLSYTKKKTTFKYLKEQQASPKLVLHSQIIQITPYSIFYL